MKRIQLMIMGLLCLFSGIAQLSDKENKALDKLIEQETNIEVDALNSKCLSALFDASFYKVKREKLYEGNGGFTESVFVKSNNELNEVISAELLIPMLKSSFQLKDNKSAEELNEALFLLFDPMASRNLSVVQKDGQWLLIQGEWFGSKTGYVVMVNDNGVIQSIEPSENIEI